MKTPLDQFRLDSKKGRRAVERLTGRAATVLDEDTVRRAAQLVDKVRRGGDKALVELVRRLDGAEVREPGDLVLARGPIPPEAEADLPPGFAEAMERAMRSIERFHQPQVHPGYTVEESGVHLEERRQAFRRVGVYVPGGRASYPSTVMMTVLPARLAGVEEIAVATPPEAFRTSAPLRHVLSRLGVTEVWGMGGAQAVAAFAYGTETIPRVDKIVGPGNAWVTAAKRLVLGDVAIDSLAGPTEVLIVADGTADPELLAADLLAQAEHDPNAAAVLVTDDKALGKKVAAAVATQLEDLSTAETARRSLANYGAVLLVDDLAGSPDDAFEVIERVAPEHLQLVGPAAEALVDRVVSAGAIFVGQETPEVFGDYVAGPSHVLPTCGSARFASALGVEDFVRRSHVVRFTAAAARRWARAAATLAAAEGLPAHAAAAHRRIDA